MLRNHAEGTLFAVPFLKRKACSTYVLDPLNMRWRCLLWQISYNLHTHCQVTGNMLQCMTDPDDVFEYVDQAVKNFDVWRLLQWLARIGSSEAQRAACLKVCSAPLINCMHVETFWMKHSPVACMS